MAGFQMPKRGSGAAMLRDLREEERPPRDEEPSPLFLTDGAAADTNSSEVADATSNIDSSAVAQTTGSAEGSIVVYATSSADSSERAGEGERSRRQKTRNSSPVTQITETQITETQITGIPVVQTTRSAVGSATTRSKVPAGGDPVRAAMLGMLAQPYPDDMEGGVMTVTSVKIPKPIWERLEYARTITKQDKQDIIAEALRLYFDRIVQGEEE